MTPRHADAGASSRRSRPYSGVTDEERATILIVEDDEATGRFLGDNLTADGHDVLLADTGRDGLRMLEYKYPDVAVVDLALPDVDGLDLIAQVRGADGVATRINPDTPLLVLTGRDGELDRLRGFERGCDDYMVKLSIRLSLGSMSSGSRWKIGNHASSTIASSRGSGTIT